MTLTETHVVNHLTNKGAATKFELSQALGCAKGTTQKAVSNLLASGRIEATAAKKKHNSLRGHTVYRIIATPVVEQPKTETAPLDIFEHANLYNRLSNLESTTTRLETLFAKLREDLNELSKDEVATYTRLNKSVKLINSLELHRIRIDEAASADRARMDGFAERLRALQPAVDPAYAAVEQELRPKLEGLFPEERIRELIDEAYAARAK
jgi:hypothetical protein